MPNNTLVQNACEECIAYQIHHNTTEPAKCFVCGQNTLEWKQDKTGTFYLKCTNCSSDVAVDLNTPCEIDPIFAQKISISIEPQNRRFENQDIMHLAKYFRFNVLQMREHLITGFTVDTYLDQIEELTELLDKYSVTYILPEYQDPREKYLYYQHCRCAYSSMKMYLR